MFNGPATGDVSGDGALVTVAGLNSLLAGYVSESQLAQTETSVQQNAAAIASTNASVASLDASTTASLAAKANASELANYAPLSSLLTMGSQSDVAAALASAAAAEASVQVLSASTTASLNLKADQSALDALSSDVEGKLSSTELSTALSG